MDAHARPTGARYIPVEDEAALRRLFDEPPPGPVLLFNYDPYCGVNAAVRRDIDTLDAEIRVVDVDANHDLGQAVAELTGVRHESPQMFVLRDGRPVWSASHFSITAERLRRVLAEPGV